MLKNNYNMLLSRWKYAEQYMDNPNIAIEKKMPFQDELFKINERLGILLDSIKEYTVDEALNGFAYEEKEKGSLWTMKQG